MRKSFKEHWAMTKYGDGRFGDWELFMNIMEVKEVNWVIDFISISAQLYVGLILNYSIIGMIIVGGVTHLSLSFILSTIGTIQSRYWRRRKDARNKFKETLDRLGLKKAKEGNKYAGKTGIKHSN